MERKEVIFTDIESIAEPQINVSRDLRYETWQAIPYEAGDHKGVMLLTSQEGSPLPVTFDLGLVGWYKIYLCLMHTGCPSYTYFKLDKDVAYSGIQNRPVGQQWAQYETVQEIFWRCEKMDGQKLKMKHPQSFAKENSSLVWIRCVPMSEEEVLEFERENDSRGEYRIHAHIDTDFMGHDEFESPEDSLIKIQYLKNSDVTMCTQEVFVDYNGYLDEKDSDNFVPQFTWERMRNRSYHNFYRIRKDAYRCMADYCHSIGVRLHAGLRMEVSSFLQPYAMVAFKQKFADEHPEYRIMSRDGYGAGALSYAYTEVQDYTISCLVEAYRNGFDGITLMWIRGTSFGFEKPVLDRISELYPGLDGRQLKAEDPRLYGVWCEFMTSFMRKLRKALDDESVNSNRARCNVHTLGCYTVHDDLLIGCDIEQWAKEGLIDGFTAGMYRHYEHLDGCMSDDDPNLVDLAKYSEWSKKHFVLDRDFGMKYDSFYNGMEEHKRIADTYGLESYYSLDWERNPDPAHYANEAAAFYERGATGVFTWDTNTRIAYPPEWAVTAKIGHKNKLNDSEKIHREVLQVHRVLKFGDHDIRYINTNWKG